MSRPDGPTAAAGGAMRFVEFGAGDVQYELLRLGNDQPVYPVSSRVDETTATAALPNELMSRPVAALTRIH